jgi:hypothetical protein
MYQFSGADCVFAPDVVNAASRLRGREAESALHVDEDLVPELHETLTHCTWTLASQHVEPPM